MVIRIEGATKRNIAEGGSGQGVPRILTRIVSRKIAITTIIVVLVYGFYQFSISTPTTYVTVALSSFKNSTTTKPPSSSPTSTSQEDEEDYVPITEWELQFNRPSNKWGIIELCERLTAEKYPWKRKHQQNPTTKNNILSSNISVTYRWCDNTRIGNSMSDYMFNRIIAAYAGIDYQLDTSRCPPTPHPKETSVFRLLGPTQPLDIGNVAMTSEAWKDACASCIDDMFSSQRYPHECRNQHAEVLIPAMRKEFQMLTTKVLELHPHLKEELDDVSIHIRLGDVLTGHMTDMGLLPFQAYLDLIPHDAKSIGIVTAPFGYDEASRMIVMGLQDYLSRHFPQANVSIRNSRNDNIPIVFTRLIRAHRATICTSSTFCLHPTLANIEGKSILIPSLLWGSKHPNWVDKLPHYFPNDDIQVPKLRFIPSTNPRNPNLQLKGNDGNQLLVLLASVAKDEYELVEYDQYDEFVKCKVYEC